MRFTEEELSVYEEKKTTWREKKMAKAESIRIAKSRFLIFASASSINWSCDGRVGTYETVLWKSSSTPAKREEPREDVQSWPDCCGL